MIVNMLMLATINYNYITKNYRILIIFAVLIINYKIFIVFQFYNTIKYINQSSKENKIHISKTIVFILSCEDI